MGSYWCTGLESCALSPLRDETTRTESNTFEEGGSSTLAKNFTLPMMLEADLAVCEPLPSSAMNLSRTPRWTGKSCTPKTVVKLIYAFR